MTFSTVRYAVVLGCCIVLAGFAFATDPADGSKYSAYDLHHASGVPFYLNTIQQGSNTIVMTTNDPPYPVVFTEPTSDSIRTVYGVASNILSMTHPTQYELPNGHVRCCEWVYTRGYMDWTWATCNKLNYQAQCDDMEMNCANFDLDICPAGYFNPKLDRGYGYQ